MSEYWTESILEILAEEDIPITRVQAERIGKSIAGCASVEYEYSGIAASTAPGKPQKSEEQKRIERLEEIIRRLGVRFGVGVDVNGGAITYYVPVGTSHMANHSEQLPY